MAKPVHSMIRVRDEQRSRDYYSRAFGLELADRFDWDTFTLVYLRHPSSPFELELAALEPSRAAISSRMSQKTFSNRMDVQ